MLNESVREENYEGVRSIAHKIKPSIRMMDMSSIQSDVELLEEFAEARTNLEQIPDLVKRVTDSCNETMKQLEKIL